MRFNLRTIASTSVAAALMLGLGACTASGSATPETSDTQSSATQQSQWPRTITDEKGSVTIEEQPKRIVNTAMSTTGSLLAIDAPVVATTVTTPGPEADSNGFFTQWSEAAAAANVQPLYKIGNFDLESIIAQDPDLIVVSTSGADSVMDHYDQLKEIAPTIVVNYSNKDWPELTRQLVKWPPGMKLKRRRSSLNSTNERHKSRKSWLFRLAPQPPSFPTTRARPPR